MIVKNCKKLFNTLTLYKSERYKVVKKLSEKRESWGLFYNTQYNT